MNRAVSLEMEGLLKNANSPFKNIFPMFCVLKGKVRTLTVVSICVIPGPENWNTSTSFSKIIVCTENKNKFKIFKFYFFNPQTVVECIKGWVSLCFKNISGFFTFKNSLVSLYTTTCLT